MTVIGSYQVWPEGLTWVFQGTVAEDGTGGTHVCTLTVTPGAGNEMQLMYALIINGNTATAQVMSARIVDSGGNFLCLLIPNISDTLALQSRSFPTNQAFTANTTTAWNGQPSSAPISGAMQLVLQVSTAAISVTQTFAVACRIKGSAPTAVLADTVGTPVLTTNTSKVFG